MAAAGSGAEDRDDERPVLKNLSGRWRMDAANSSDRSALMAALGVGFMARMVLGNPVTSLDVRHSRTRLEIDTSTSHGTLGEEHVLDGERRSKANSGEQVLAKAWEDENGAVVVETTWPKRGITTLDTRELDTRTRLRQTTAVLKDGEQVHQAVIVYDKVEDPDEREAAEAAEERAREATALRWASLGIVASAPDEGRAALSSHVAATSGHAGDVPTEDEAAAARRLLAVTEALPRDRWDQSGSWTLDRKESGDPMPVLAAIGVPWLLRGTVASLNVTTETVLRPAGPLTPEEREEAGTVLSDPEAAARDDLAGLWSTVDRTSMGESRALFVLDGRCRRRDTDKGPMYLRAWQAGARAALRRALGRGEEGEEEEGEGPDAAVGATAAILSGAPDGAVVIETVLGQSAGHVAIVEVREPLDGGRRGRATVRVFGPAKGAATGIKGRGADRFEEEPRATQVKVLDNGGYDGREKEAEAALARARETVEAAERAGGAAAETGEEEEAGGGTAAAKTRPAAHRPPAPGSVASSADRPTGSGSVLPGRPAARASSALDCLDLSGRWRLDEGRSQPVEAAIGGATPGLAALLRPRLCPPPRGFVSMHHTESKLQWDLRGASSPASHRWAALLDGKWRHVGHGDAGRGGPFFPVRASQAESGAVTVETRLVLARRRSSGVVEAPPGPTLRESMYQPADDRSEVWHIITLVAPTGEEVGVAQRRLLREESAEERMLGAAQARRRAEEEAARRREAEEAAAAAEASAREGYQGGDEDGEDEEDEDGEEGAGGRLSRGTRRGMQTLLQAAVKDFFGDDAGVSVEGGRAVLRLPPRDERERATLEARCMRQCVGEVGLFFGILTMALLVSLSPSLSKAEAVLAMGCAMLVYAVASATPCIRNRGEGRRQTMLRRVRERMEAGDEAGATDALLAEAAARTLERTMAEQLHARTAAEAAQGGTGKAAERAGEDGAGSARRRGAARRDSDADHVAADPWGAAARGST